MIHAAPKANEAVRMTNFIADRITQELGAMNDMIQKIGNQIQKLVDGQQVE